MAFLDKTGLERLWLHILSKTNQTLASAKQYADDIKNDLLNGAGSAYDTLKELGDLIDENADAIDAIQRLADTKSDKGHIHDDRYYTEAEVDDALKFLDEAKGNIITVNNSAELPLNNLKLYGKTTQDGTPTPNNPVPLVNVGAGGSIGVKASGKNLIDMRGAAGGTDSGITVTVNADGSYVMNGTATDINVNVWFKGYYNANAPTLFVLPAGTYYVAGIALYSGVRFVSGNHQPGGSYFTIAEDTPITGVRCTFVTSGQTYSNTVVYPIVAAGNAVAAFEPYKDGGSLTASTPNGLPGIPVTSGGNYIDENGQQWICDEIDFGRGVYVQRVKRVILTGAETWNVSSRSNTFLCNNVTDSVNVGDGTSHQTLAMSNKYASVDWETIAFYDYAVALPWGVGFAIRNKDCDTPEAFKAYLASNNCEVAYVLASPIEKPLSADELAAFRAMTTQNPTTVIYNDAAADMYVSYGTYKAGEMYEALGLDETTSLDYLPITGGVITGEGTVKLIPQRSNMEGGEIALGAPSGSPTLNSIILDNYNGEFRVFGYPSADCTTKTGTGTPLVIDPYDKTVSGAGGTYTFNGIATSANKLNTNAGAATQPVYFVNGVPTATTHVLEKSVPSDAVFTDTQVTQTATATSNYRPLIMGSNSSANTSTLQQTTCGAVTVNNSLYAQASTGSLYANKYVVNSAVSMEYDSTNECLNFVFK